MPTHKRLTAAALSAALARQRSNHPQLIQLLVRLVAVVEEEVHALIVVVSGVRISGRHGGVPPAATRQPA
jgi:hypothetical protein